MSPMKGLPLWGDPCGRPVRAQRVATGRPQGSPLQRAVLSDWLRGRLAPGRKQHSCGVPPVVRHAKSLPAANLAGKFVERISDRRFGHGLALPLQRLARNSLRRTGREFVAPGQGNFSSRAGNFRAWQGIDDHATNLLPIRVHVSRCRSDVGLILTGRILVAS